MYDYGFRNYDPAVGRWLNVDPLAERRDSYSPYVYCLNNPVLRLDPNGLTDFTFNKKTVSEVGRPIKTQDYLSGLIYSNGILEVMPTAEGYVKNTVVAGANRYNYVYNHTDHLGNVRLSYGQDPVTQEVKILEENNYYPFGMKHKNYNMSQRSYIKSGSGVAFDLVCAACPVPYKYNYKYNGKELQDELGLNLYDYGARNYDPAIGRWMNIDPLADVSRRWSPYNYAMDNPVYYIDPDGMLSDSFIKNLWNNSGNNTNWVSNNDGTFSGDNGMTIVNDEPPVNFFSNSEGQENFNSVFALKNKKGNYKEGDGIFTVYGHGSSRHIGDNKFGKHQIFDAAEFDKTMSERSPAYKDKMQSKESFVLFLYTCESASEYNPGDKSIARKISEAHPNATVIGFDGYVIYGKNDIQGISKVLGDNYNDNKGHVVGYQNGKEVFRALYSDYLKTGPTSK